jgi:glycine dehydrogenase subunit 1
LDGTFFNEFLISCRRPVQSTLDALLEHKIIGGADAGDRVVNGIVFALTEQNTRAEIDRLIVALDEIGSAS